MSKERRAYTRFRLDVPASMSLYQVDVRHVGSIIDLSLGGCFFPISGDLPIGENCRIQLTSGVGLETEIIELSGVVTRKNRQGVGIHFIELLPEQKMSLERIISREVGL